MSILPKFRAAVVGLCLLCLTFAAAAPARAQAPLDQISADAPVAIVVPSMSKLAQKLAMLNEAMGLNIPQMGDALGTFKQELGVNKGFKDDGAMIVVLTSADALASGSPQGVILMPVTDYAAFVGGLGGDGAAAVTEVKMSGGRPGFAKKIDGYAVMSETKEVVEAYKPAGKGAALKAASGKLGERYMSGSDAMIYVNMPVLWPKIKPEIEKAMKQAEARMDQQNKGAQAALGKAVVRAYFDGVSAAARDSDGAVIALDINELGVGLTGTMQFKAGTPTAAIFGTGGDASGALARVPDQAYLLATATNFTGVKLKTIVENGLAYLPQDQFGNFITAIKKAMPLIDSVKSAGQAYYVPAQGGMMMGEGLNGVTVMETTDAKAYVKTYKEVFQSFNNMKLSVGPAPAPAADGAPVESSDVTFTSSYQDNVLEISGVSVDRYEMKYTLPQSVMRELTRGAGPMAGMMGAANGQTGQTGYIAASGNYVVTTTSLNEETVRLALASLKDTKGIGTQSTMGQVRGNLSPKPSMEMYVGIAGILTTANSFLQMMGQPALQVPADLPPIGVSASVQDSGAASRVFVPIPVVRFIKDTYNAMQNRMGGVPGGGGGGPQPAPF